MTARGRTFLAELNPRPSFPPMPATVASHSLGSVSNKDFGAA